MKTTYLTTLTAVFNPFLKTSKVPRLLLARLPASAHKTVKITVTQLPRSSTAPATVDISLKDGKTLKYSWAYEAPEAKVEEASSDAAPAKKRKRKVVLADIVEEVDRHARGLARQEELKG